MPLALLEFSAAASIIDLRKDSVRFSHQLLQEFFTAQSFSEKIAEGLKATELWNPTNWWETNGWEEAAKLAVDYESDPSVLLHWLAEGNPRLAVEFAREQNLLEHKDELFQDYKSTWQLAITDIEKHPNPHERHAISTVLAWLDWDDRVGIGVSNAKLPDIDWVEVLGGAFIYSEKDKQQSLSTDTFSISRFPVTNKQFQLFVKAGGYENDQWWEGLKKPDELPNHTWKEANRPVESIDWYESIAFCRWLSSETGEDIRLPTEQQWEKAARGTQGNEYPWGRDYISGYANINETWDHDKVGEYNLQETSAVGIYPHAKSPCHVMDMSGNMDEWCLNKYEEAEIITTDLSNDNRVVRGGSWYYGTGLCRSSFRFGWLPGSRSHYLGFRLVRIVSPSSDH
jgi:formylglycine-generating enzyme required for sulfatase activity